MSPWQNYQKVRCALFLLLPVSPSAGVWLLQQPRPPSFQGLPTYQSEPFLCDLLVSALVNVRKTACWTKLCKRWIHNCNLTSLAVSRKIPLFISNEKPSYWSWVDLETGVIIYCSSLLMSWLASALLKNLSLKAGNGLACSTQRTQLFSLVFIAGKPAIFPMNL